jgi:hypothetical protein
MIFGSKRSKLHNLDWCASLRAHKFMGADKSEQSDTRSKLSEKTERIEIWTKLRESQTSVTWWAHTVQIEVLMYNPAPNQRTTQAAHWWRGPLTDKRKNEHHPQNVKINFSNWFTEFTAVPLSFNYWKQKWVLDTLILLYKIHRKFREVTSSSNPLWSYL